MPLYKRDTVREQTEGPASAGSSLTTPAPKHRLPRDETLPGEAFLSGRRYGGRPRADAAPLKLRYPARGQNAAQATDELYSGQREPVKLTTTLISQLPSELARSEAAIRIIRRGAKRLRASRDVEELSRIVPMPLVELGHFDRVFYWRIDGLVLVPVSTAFADGMAPSREVLEDAFASPISLERADIEAAAVRCVEEAEVCPSRLHRQFSLLLGAASYAVAVVKDGQDAVGLLQAARRNLDADSLDRELLWSFAEICGTVMQRHAVTRQLNRQNDMIRAMQRFIADPDDGATALRPAPSDGLAPGDDAEDHKIAEVLAPLTRREREVFQLLLSGAPNTEIARELVIANATVKSHVQSILHKFGVANRSQVIVRYNAAVGGKVNTEAVVTIEPIPRQAPATERS